MNFYKVQVYTRYASLLFAISVFSEKKIKRDRTREIFNPLQMQHDPTSTVLSHIARRVVAQLARIHSHAAHLHPVAHITNVLHTYKASKLPTRHTHNMHANLLACRKRASNQRAEHVDERGQRQRPPPPSAGNTNKAHKGMISAFVRLRHMRHCHHAHLACCLRSSCRRCRSERVR